MQPVLQAVLRSWSIPPVATFALVLTALTYLRGAWLLRRAGFPHLPAWRIGSFVLELFALWFALASPLDTFSGFVLTAHMLQHMMLMMVAPPLILLGEPLIPIVRGMPRFAAREFAGPLLNWPPAQRIGLVLTNPVVALVLMGVVMLGWHVPGPYELALRSSSWHQAEHACFFFTSIIFWWPVVQPWPSRARWPRWAMVPYLVIADLQNTALSAVLVFSDRILYPSYAGTPSLFGFTPQEDQAAAGAIMWVVGSLAFIVPAVLIAIQCLTRRRTDYAAQVSRRDEHSVVDRAVSVASVSSSPTGIFGIRLTGQSLEAASFVVLFVLAAAGFAVLSGLAADDDDQVLLTSKQAGAFAISVYGPEGDIPVGPASFGVLIQDRMTREVLLDPQVDISVRKANDDASAAPEHQRALPADENKLAFSADMDFPSAGSWVVQVAVRRASESALVSLPILVTSAEAGQSVRWSYIVILVVSGVLCAVYLWRHRARRSAALTAPIA